MYWKSLYLYLVLLFIAVFVFSSCTKKTDETSQEKNNEVTTEAVSDSNFTETDEDLLTVDYKQFYDELAPHGEWVQVTICSELKTLMQMQILECFLPGNRHPTLL